MNMGIVMVVKIVPWVLSLLVIIIFIIGPGESRTWASQLLVQCFFSSSLHFPYTLQSPVRGMFERRIFHNCSSGIESEREALLARAWILRRAAEILDGEPCHTWWDPASFEVKIKVLHGLCWEDFFFFFLSHVPLAFLLLRFKTFVLFTWMYSTGRLFLAWEFLP